MINKTRSHGSDRLYVGIDAGAVMTAICEKRAPMNAMNA